ncbi:MAG: SDR family NAD(P)-dependent oxidoreductase [Acidimicrobiales bacterium]
MTVAIVTGASEGLGRALGLELARQGWDLVVDARRPGPLAAAAESFAALGVTVRAVAGDVTGPVHRAALGAAAEELGGVDLLVANAGTLGPSPLPAIDELDPAALRQALEANVVAPLALVSLLLPSLRRRHGTVVAVTSDAAVEAYRGWGAYGASKAALEQAHHVLGAEEPDIRVYRFDPGDMRTSMRQAAFPGEDISDRPEPDVAAAALVALLRHSPPSGRYRAADIAAVVA